MSETYAAFDVDVTTDSSNDDTWKRTSSGDTTYGTRVVVTSDPAAAQQACASACVGVAYLGTFGDVDSAARYQPAWVFASPVGGRAMSPVVAAQTVAHEAGHTFDLAPRRPRLGRLPRRHRDLGPGDGRRHGARRQPLEQR